IGAVPLALRCAACAPVHATGWPSPHGRTTAGLLVRLVPRLATCRRVGQRQGTPPTGRMGLMAHFAFRPRRRPPAAILPATTACPPLFTCTCRTVTNCF